MQYKVFSIIFICFIAAFISCEKTPKKGDYKGTFTGELTTDSMNVEYTTEYYFDATHSTKKELRLKEKQSQITSILKKHENDSISGMLGFGSIYNPDGDSGGGFNTVSIQGKYDKNSISGKFSTTYSDGKKEYLSEGVFNLIHY
ncbi:MAG: hypothetical protein LBI60_00140 [Bacteroidales bacterium]|jgi:hypothetical protein|nr:hypothetical protein [Bacteroidales bacterium]